MGAVCAKFIDLYPNSSPVEALWRRIRVLCLKFFFFFVFFVLRPLGTGRLCDCKKRESFSACAAELGVFDGRQNCQVGIVFG
jgi:hypothetical protein